jgi:tetratricopeptide (TPR) repeat protein
MMLIALALLLQEPVQPDKPCTLPAATEAGSAEARACEKAIVLADRTGRAQLLAQRGYAWNEKNNALAALPDLDAAVAADPDNIAARQERAFTNNDLGNYAEGLADLDAAAAHGVASARLFTERALSRSRLGDIKGAVADRDRVIAITPDDAQAFLARAGDLLWLGRFADARADLDRADAIAAKSGDAELKQSIDSRRAAVALWSTGAAANPESVCRATDTDAELRAPTLIATCTAAFLAAPTGKAKAEMLTIRSMAWMIARQDEASGTVDRQMAVALDPGNPDLRANLGASYVSAHHSWAAEREFDRSLAIKENWPALAGRAAARYNLGNPDGAFADAKRSFEIKPNELALTVLGDLLHDKKDDKAAKLYWMGAWQLGDRDDGLLARLKSIGVTDPAHDPAAK